MTLRALRPSRRREPEIGPACFQGTTQVSKQILEKIAQGLVARAYPVLSL